HRAPLSFPTRRSSDLLHTLGVAHQPRRGDGVVDDLALERVHRLEADVLTARADLRDRLVRDLGQRVAARAAVTCDVEHESGALTDRKSTRLNSSHVKI